MTSKTNIYFLKSSIENHFKSSLQTLTLELEEDENETQQLRLITIIIKKTKRRKGFGSLIMQEIIEFSNKHRIPIILKVSDVYGCNFPRLVKFYEKCGFVGLVEDLMFYQPPKDKINGEQAFPIYSFSAKWAQDGVQDPEYPNSFKDLPEDRIWNSTSFTKMFKTEQTEDDLEAFQNEWWEHSIKSVDHYDNIALESKNISDLVLNHKFIEFEVWNLLWFEHMTFDIGKSNEEVLRSFEDFVRRKEELNKHYRYKTGEDRDKYCLMGAEDRWRWHGAEPNGERDDHSPAPCRCKYCKQFGVVKITH